MNRCNDWEKLLSIFNDDLKETGYSLSITEPEDGFYNCEIWEDGKRAEIYAENYYEDELTDLLYDAFEHVRTELC